jgi:hypothetical protein
MITIPQVASAFQLLLFQVFAGEHIASKALAVRYFTQKLRLRGPPQDA